VRDLRPRLDDQAADAVQAQLGGCGKPGGPAAGHKNGGFLDAHDHIISP
jgi:hypothetical protein